MMMKICVFVFSIYKYGFTEIQGVRRVRALEGSGRIQILAGAMGRDTVYDNDRTGRSTDCLTAINLTPRVMVRRMCLCVRCELYILLFVLFRKIKKNKKFTNVNRMHTHTHTHTFPRC